IENSQTNLCGIVDKNSLKKYGANFDSLLKGVAAQTQDFQAWYEGSQRKTGWITCAALIHGQRKESKEGVFYAGDSACFLEPFMGQGMTMA
ncbi:hypothetical protein N4G37_13710, partial [Enterococcus faecalis]|uniref:hypothetical protein n=1 Tax=Enterococcus faecalis TaxID=1351 RepID=UPI0021B0D7E1